MKDKKQRSAEIEVRSKLNKVRNEIHKLDKKVHILDKKEYPYHTRVGNDIHKMGVILSYFEEARKNIYSILKRHKK